MATTFQILSTDWYSEYSNGSTFTGDPLIVSNYFVGNVMENVRIERQIQIGTSFNLSETVTTDFRLDLVSGIIGFIRGITVNFQNENFYDGATLEVTYGTSTVTGQCLGFTGVNNQDLIVDSTIAAALQTDTANFPRTDLSIKIISAPTFLDYSYNTVPNDATNLDFTSPYSPVGSVASQTYRIRVITNTFTEMYFVGGYEGCDLGSARVKFDQTVDGYLHVFTIQHDFLIPYFIDGEVPNIQNVVNPPRFGGTVCFKYISRFDLGINPGTLIVSVNDTANNSADSGYYAENFNGNPNDFEVQNLQFIVNGQFTNTIDVQETTNVSFDVIANAGTFNSGTPYVLSHSRLCTVTEYAGQHDPFEEVWILDQIRAKLLALGVTSTIIQNVTTTASAGQASFNFDIVFNQDQRNRIQTGDFFIISLDIASENQGDANLINRVQLPIVCNAYRDNSDIPDLIFENANTFWNSWLEVPNVLNSGNRLNLWDGDLINFLWAFRTDATAQVQINSIDLEIGFFYDGEWVVIKGFPLLAQNGGSNIPQVVINGTPPAYFDVVNVSSQNGLNLPSGHLKNIEITAQIPTTYQTFQQWTLEGGFYISWRDWVSNPNIPAALIDYTKPNNNQNEKTSNYYLPLESIAILAGLRINTTSPTGFQQINNTEYLLNSGFWSVNDFDEDFITPITGSITIMDEDGNVIDEVYTDQDVLIMVQFDHNLGFKDIADFWGRIWLEIPDTQIEPWSLSTELNWTDQNNWLQPSQNIDPLNLDFVEKESLNNIFRLYCKTNSSNLTPNVNYRPYGRIGPIKK